MMDLNFEDLFGAGMLSVLSLVIAFLGRQQMLGGARWVVQTTMGVVGQGVTLLLSMGAFLKTVLGMIDKEEKQQQGGQQNASRQRIERYRRC